MQGPAFHSLAQHFSLLRLRVYIQLERDTEWPAFKGSMLHGWFGHALKSIDEQAFFVLFGEHETGQPKPYTITPNHDLKTFWKRNEVYYFDISLFGAAIRFSEQVVTACQAGAKMGLGKDRCRFSLISLCSVTPSGLTPGVHPAPISDWLTPVDHDGTLRELALHFETPIRLKEKGKIIRSAAPRLEHWLNHIIRRWQKLGLYWVNDNPDLYRALYEELPPPADYEQTSHVFFEDWQRYSHKESSTLPFGGLKGQVSFYGDLGAALSWLQVGELIHIGGKTTFGLGKFQLIS